jgi:hypothetical protein
MPHYCHLRPERAPPHHCHLDRSARPITVISTEAHAPLLSSRPKRSEVERSPHWPLPLLLPLPFFLSFPSGICFSSLSPRIPQNNFPQNPPKPPCQPLNPPNHHIPNHIPMAQPPPSTSYNLTSPTNLQGQPRKRVSKANQEKGPKARPIPA